MALKTDKIHEGNKLIAEFMGWTLKRYPSHMKTPYHGKSIWWSSGKTKTFCCEEGQEHFDDSWEWLMPVVNKIEVRDYWVDICFVQCLIGRVNDGGKTIVEADGVSKIEATWLAIVKFIKWHNKNNENAK